MPAKLPLRAILSDAVSSAKTVTPTGCGDRTELDSVTNPIPAPVGNQISGAATELASITYAAPLPNPQDKVND